MDDLAMTEEPTCPPAARPHWLRASLPAEWGSLDEADDMDLAGFRDRGDAIRRSLGDFLRAFSAGLLAAVAFLS